MFCFSKVFTCLAIFNISVVRFAGPFYPKKSITPSGGKKNHDFLSFSVLQNIEKKSLSSLGKKVICADWFHAQLSFVIAGQSCLNTLFADWLNQIKSECLNTVH
jgi:hypothetical protein